MQMLLLLESGCLGYIYRTFNWINSDMFNSVKLKIVFNHNFLIISSSESLHLEAMIVNCIKGNCTDCSLS
jgi:hypothetical protein